MGDTHERGWPKHRKAEHAHEHQPPHQEKGLNAGDDNWGIHGTSLSVTDPKVSSEPGDVIAGSLVGNYMRPVYDEAHESAYIHESHTQGRKKE